MEIRIQKVRPADKRSRPIDESKLGFGVYFSDHIFKMDYEEGRGWHDPRIEPYDVLHLDPAALVLHYAQQVFEGLKAYRRSDGGIQLFRPRDNIRRMNRSARRLCMPEIEEDFALEALKELIRLDEEWVPSSDGASLYIRPTMIATEPALGVKISPTYLYYVITGPVGAYYPEGFNPTKILVTDKYVRAAPGGVGEAKTAGNYAASLLAAKEAHEMGYTQVLWLDAVHHKYVEEVGTSNIFFVIDDELITPPLTGSILPGITRDSVIQLARDWGVRVTERPITIDEVIESIGKGRMRELFATGTAAVISPVGEICYRDEIYSINEGKVGELSLRLYEELTGIQYGRLPDPHGWIEKVT
jgi:branched-chain amino acid aminotransferase